MKDIVLASGNKGKLREIQQVLAPLNWQLRPQSDFNAGEVAETGLTFVENAIFKARHAAVISGIPALADDSGLEVDALNGQPGIYSARFSGQDATDTKNNRKLLDELKNIPDKQRTARFQCVLVYMRHAEDPVPIIAQGSWEGIILHQPIGDNGFGYDPLFFALDQQSASAQLPPEVKNKVSHRAIALQQLIQRLTADTPLAG